MKRYLTTVARSPEGCFSSRSLEDDGFDAIQSIPFTREVEVENVSEEEVKISYSWDGPDDFKETSRYLSPYGVMNKNR